MNKDFAVIVRILECLNLCIFPLSILKCLLLLNVFLLCYEDVSYAHFQLPAHLYAVHWLGYFYTDSPGVTFGGYWHGIFTA